MKPPMFHVSGFLEGRTLSVAREIFAKFCHEDQQQHRKSRNDELTSWFFIMRVCKPGAIQQAPTRGRNYAMGFNQWVEVECKGFLREGDLELGRWAPF